VADAFCATRLGGDWGTVLGTLPAGVPVARLVDRGAVGDRTRG
jgi:putative acyl-CoA dehydrogenase